MNNAAIIDPRSPDDVKKNLASLGLDIIPIPRTSLVAEPVSGHPDIQIFVHKKSAFTHPDISPDFIKLLGRYCDINVCTTKLNREYPLDIAYNVACTGNTAIHKMKNTAPEIIKYFTENNIDLINTKQGYSKCSTLIAGSKSIITSDNSIHKSAEANGLDSLLIMPGFFDLPGYNYGFIGGASGQLEKTILMSGRIDHHPDYEKITDFLKSRGMDILYLSENPAVDIGSILII